MSKAVSIIVIAVSILGTARANEADNATVTQHPPVQRGIALGLYEKDPKRSYFSLLKEIKALGATHVSIVHPWYMKTARDEEIFEHPIETTPWPSLKRAIRDAKRAGLKVFLFPILRVEDKVHGWRGTLKPENVDLFFENYTALMMRFAKLAEKMALPMLSVGSELASMEFYEEKWRTLIRRIRGVYSGKLVYSANWDNYENTPFVDALDYAGVTGYFELAQEGAEPTVADLVHTWRYVRMDLVRWSTRVKRPLIITEIGYLSQENAAAWPWKEGARNKVDVELQRKCYEALRRAWDNEPLLEGVYMWQWFGEGGLKDYEYTPRNKPAAQEIEKWYTPADKAVVPDKTGDSHQSSR